MAKRQEPITPERIIELTTRFTSARESLQNAQAALDSSKQKVEVMEKQLESAKLEYEALLEQIKNG